MFDGLDLKAATGSPKKESPPRVVPVEASTPVSAFSFLNDSSPTVEPETNGSSLLDLQAPSSDASLPSTPKAIGKRAIVKKKRAKPRVGYAREEEEEPVAGSPAPMTTPAVEESPVLPDPTPPPPAAEEKEEPVVPPVEEPPVEEEETDAAQSEGPTEAELWGGKPEFPLKTEEAPSPAPAASASADQESSIPLQVPDYSSEPATAEPAKKKKGGMLQRMFGPKHGKNKKDAEEGDVVVATDNPSVAVVEDDGKTQEEQENEAAVVAAALKDAKEEEEAAATTEEEAPGVVVIPEPEEDEEPPAPPPKEKSPEEELGDKIAGFVSGTTDLCFRLSEHERRAAEVGREKAALASEQAEFESELKEKVREQERLAEAEEYELADELNSSVERLKQEMALRAAALRDLALEVDRAEREMGVRRVERLRAAEDVARWLNAFETAQRDALKTASRDATQRREAAVRRVEAEAERLSMERAHVERDAAHVAEEFDRMEKLIEAQTAGDAERRDELARDKAAKEAEIDELKMRLAAATAERDSINVELEETDAKISTARAKFERQLQRLEQRDAMVKASAADCDAELGALDKEKAAIETAAVEAKSMAAQRSRVADAASVELDVARRLAAAASVWQQEPSQEQADDKDGENPADDDASLEAELQALRVTVAEAEETAHEATGNRRELESKRTALLAERASIDERIPQLEASKKAAASARQYKEAGALAKEVKMWATKREEVLSKLDGMSEPLAEASSKAEEATKTHETAKADLADRERDADVRRLRALRRKAKELKAIQNRFASDAKSSKLAAAAASLARVELANISARADDLCRERKLQAYDEVDDEPLLDIQELAEEVIADQPDFEEQPTPSIEQTTQKQDVPDTPTVEDDDDKEGDEEVTELPPASPDPPAEDEATGAEEEEAEKGETEDDDQEKEIVDRSAELPELKARVEQLNSEIDAAVEQDDFDTADTLSTELTKIEEEIAEIVSQSQS